VSERRDERVADARAAGGHGLTGLVVLLIAVLGVPQVWADVTGGGGLGLESVFFPVLGIAFPCLAVSRRTTP
jgi:hypothetical protein